MDLIIGGKGQGKLDFAKVHYKLSDTDISSALCGKAKLIYNLQDIIEELLKEEKDPQKIICEYIKNHSDIIFICDEIGCGLVPVDAFERQKREVVGRVCCKIAVMSDNVYRVFCGIPTQIK